MLVNAFSNINKCNFIVKCNQLFALGFCIIFIENILYIICINYIMLFYSSTVFTVTWNINVDIQVEHRVEMSTRHSTVSLDISMMLWNAAKRDQVKYGGLVSDGICRIRIWRVSQTSGEEGLFRCEGLRFGFNYETHRIGLEEENLPSLNSTEYNGIPAVRNEPTRTK